MLIVFLAETKCGDEITKKVKIVGNFYGCLTVRSISPKGGLCLLWKNAVDLRVISYSQNHIDCEILWNEKRWRFTGVYGYPEGNRKALTWSLLRKLHNGNDFPWLVGGDFNEILCDAKKVGINFIEKFRETLDDYNLKDLNFIGSSFTWNNRRHNDVIWESLDRFLWNSSLEKPPWSGSGKTLGLDIFYHRPIKFSLINMHSQVRSDKRRPFRFEEH